MSARIYGLGPTEQARYPDKRFATLRAVAKLKDVFVTKTDDERGDEIIIVTRGAWTRQFRQISDAERLIKTILYPKSRWA